MLISAYIKPTNFCNIGCEHCYLPEAVRANKSRMSDDSLRATAQLLLGMAAREHKDGIEITWHGGEPLMISPRWYRHAISILDEEIGSDYYTQSMQTSLLPYRSEWAELLHQRFGGHVGTSVDFTLRTIKSSPEAYLDLFLTKVEMARKDGLLVVPGMVPSRKQVGHGAEIVDWFVANGFDEFGIDRYSKYGTSIEDWPTNTQHSTFLREVFDRMMELDRQGVSPPYCKTIAAGIHGVLHGLPGDRWGTTCQRDFIVIEPDGSLNSCPDRATHESPFANVKDGAEDLIASPKRRHWIRIASIDHKGAHCFSCEFRSWCLSGCPITPNNPTEEEPECSGYKRFFLSHIRDVCQDPVERERAIRIATPPGEPILPAASLQDKFKASSHG